MAPVKGKKQISEIRLCGAPLGVKRVHGVVGEGTEMRLASRSTPRHRISDQTCLAAYDLLDVRPVSISWDYAETPMRRRMLGHQVG